MICPGVEIKSVEGDPLLTDWNFYKMGSHFFVEAVAVHAEIEGRKMFVAAEIVVTATGRPRVAS